MLVRSTTGQIDDLIAEIGRRTDRGERTLVTTLTRKMAEDLTVYLQELGVKVQYLHFGVKTMERAEILRDLRSGVHDVIVGINLLREGLDLPEVTLVAILDADKEGFLRSETSLIQTIGRAARNVSGQVIMYADSITGSMARAIDETNRRRLIQVAYNEEHGITPTTIRKAIRDLIMPQRLAEEPAPYEAQVDLTEVERMPLDQVADLIDQLEKQMREAARALEFERAAQLRDEISQLRRFAPMPSIGKRPKAAKASGSSRRRI